MSYNKENFPQYVKTAGKISIATALTGLAVFLFAFVFDVGTQEFNRVSAQSATTTLTVLNTPPSFTLEPYEVIGSATTTPTNSGDVIQWSAIGTDSNGAPYFLLVCSTNASPTANAASGPGNLGSAPPVCGGGVQWGVSASTTSGALATVSTTTAEGGLFSTSTPNQWYAWVCDDDPNNPRCNSIPSQGLYATSSSPFHVNSRPVFTAFGNNGPKDPGTDITFYSTSSDPDTLGGEQNIFLVVCSTNSDYNPSTNTCDANFIASTTINMTDDASATKTLAAILRDNTYAAYGYVVDQYGHEAVTNPINVNFVVNNVAPTISGGDISLNGGSDITLTTPGGETSGFTINFKLKDANSCLNAASSSEFAAVESQLVSVFKSSLGTTTCDGTSGSYDPNDCYPSGVGTTTWNLSCSADYSCASPLSDEMDYTCTFPLWFIADPTDAASPDVLDNWSVAVAGMDDDGLVSSMATTSNPKELITSPFFDIGNNSISYNKAGAGIEPGDNSGTLSATSTTINLGNAGLDQTLDGESMCGTFAVGNECKDSATSTIPEWRQQFATTSYAYDADATEGGVLLDPNILQLSSSTVQELELNLQKPNSTSTQFTKNIYWGIAVPGTISLAGAYTGLNTFYMQVSEAVDW